MKRFRHSFQNLLALLLMGSRAAFFGLLLLIAFACTAWMGHDAFWGLYRYDYLLFYALIIQLILLLAKMESINEAKVIALFHVLGMLMEIFKTHPAIGAWIYPQPAVFKLWMVPLFAGFMYSAVGSFFARALKLFQVQLLNLPKFRWLMLLTVLSYCNFMLHHFIVDLRFGLFLLSVVLFWRCRIQFKIDQQIYQSPFLPISLAVAILIWLAENVSTYYQIWLYPSQVDSWHMVSVAKIGSWYLLMLLSLVLVLWVMGKRDAAGHWRLDVSKPH